MGNIWRNKRGKRNSRMSRKGQLNTVCLRCGMSFHTRPSHITRKYCSRICWIKDLSRACLTWKGGAWFSAGSDHPRWKGRAKRISSGKVKGPRSFLPMAHNDGRIEKHRLVMAVYLGRLLSIEEVVHHKNGNRLDNKIENLELFVNQGEHSRLHQQMDRRKKASAALF